jgi:streptomycin 6-kinase
MLHPDFVLDDGSRERLVARFGGGVDAWCAALPEMVKLYCLRWHLELDKALAGNGSRVFIGKQNGSRGVVLKLTPDRAIANEEAIALRAWAATPHAVDLLDADLEAGALLLENIEPGTDRLWGWCQATAAALVILRLRRRPPDATTQLLLEIAASN